MSFLREGGLNPIYPAPVSLLICLQASPEVHVSLKWLPPRLLA